MTDGKSEFLAKNKYTGRETEQMKEIGQRQKQRKKNQETNVSNCKLYFSKLQEIKKQSCEDSNTTTQS